ncbi:MAG: GlsB/YeaQ/YmgE family stress response membrane protein [Pirellulales bacterium]|nr:GlsB/YeaQ/YmgE family stress response membrane protein [Pirellulales bacterium]
MEFSPVAQHWVNVVLIWIGFGTLAGMLAMVLLPIKRPDHPLAMLLLGIVGSAVGLWGLTYLLPGRQINPISPPGFVAATAGAFVTLLLYRSCVACKVGKKHPPPV